MKHMDSGSLRCCPSSECPLNSSFCTNPEKMRRHVRDKNGCTVEGLSLVIFIQPTQLKASLVQGQSSCTNTFPLTSHVLCQDVTEKVLWRISLRKTLEIWLCQEVFLSPEKYSSALIWQLGLKAQRACLSLKPAQQGVVSTQFKMVYTPLKVST